MSAPSARDARMARPDGLSWRTCRFGALDVTELDRIYAARQTVFGIEQQCVYLDADGYDEDAWHVAAWSSAQRLPLAYARLLDPARKYAEPSLGRVITVGAARGTGLGREIVRRVLELGEAVWPGLGNRISAQSRLERFYREFGFEAVGAPYLEDGILHTEMLRPARRSG
jgi:ElaA protein